MNSIVFTPSINLHLTERCNMNCRGCFANYDDCAELSEDKWLSMLDILRSEFSDAHKMKINFVGGEPTLLPFLPKLVAKAKSLGAVTGIVTNGVLLGESILEAMTGSLDWVGISIDSLRESSNYAIGRVCTGHVMTQAEYSQKCVMVKNAGMKLKINTVVSQYNKSEDFAAFLECVKPERWKVMQYLQVAGQNDQVKGFDISKAEYDSFVSRHCYLPFLIRESIEEMVGSYIMIDPSGRPYGNKEKKVSYGECVLEKGLRTQVINLGYSSEATKRRGGFYFTDEV